MYSIAFLYSTGDQQFDAKIMRKNIMVISFGITES
jgi:hypothetical protein